MNESKGLNTTKYSIIIMLTQYGKEILPELIKIVDENTKFYDCYDKLSDIGVTYIGRGARRAVFANRYDNDSSNILSGEYVLKIDFPKVVNNIHIGGNKLEIANYIEVGQYLNKYFVPVTNYDKKNARWLIMPMTKGTVSQHDIDNYYFSLADKNIHMARSYGLNNSSMGFHEGLVKLHDYDIRIYKNAGKDMYVNNFTEYFNKLTD